MFLSFSSAAQLILNRNEYIKQDDPTINDSAQSDAQFSNALAAAGTLLLIGALCELPSGRRCSSLFVWQLSIGLH